MSLKLVLLKKRLPLLASKDGSIAGAFPEEFPNITSIPNGLKHSRLSNAVSLPTPS